MNKNDLIAAVAESSGLTKADAGRAVDAVFSSIEGALKGGGEVRIVGFGTFSVAHRAATTGPRFPPEERLLSQSSSFEQRPCRASGRLSRGSRASSTREHPCRRVPGALETLGARSRPGQRRIACKGWRRRTTGCGPRWPGSSPACCTWRRRDPATCRPRLVGRAGRRRGGPPRLAFPTALQCLAWSRSKRCAHRAIAWPCSSHTPAPSQRRARSNY